MEALFGFIVTAFLGSTIIASSVKIVSEKHEYLVERLGSYQKKLEPGLNFVVPMIDKVVYQNTIKEKVLDIPPQACITRDNVSITVDAVVYWRIVDMYKSYYKVEDLQLAITNLILTQIRSEMGKLDLDQTFTARAEINEILLRDLDIATDPWGVKVTRVELRDIIPSKAVQESMELQMAAERKKRAAILTSEGQRESAINSAQGKAEAQVLEAEAHKKALILKAEAQQQEQILKAQATAQAIETVMQALSSDRRASQALEFLLAQRYIDMGQTIGSSESSKVMFMDPKSILASLEGMKAIITETHTPDNISPPVEMIKPYPIDNRSSLVDELEKLDRGWEAK